MSNVKYDNESDLVPGLDSLLADAESLVTRLKEVMDITRPGQRHPSTGIWYTLDERLLVIGAYQDAERVLKALDRMWKE